MTLLKFKLKRHSFNQIYISYLLRICISFFIFVHNTKKNQINKIQYEAGRIVTGFTRSVSINNLLKEVGVILLSDRRKIQKYVFTYKTWFTSIPEYLHELFPGTVQEINDDQYVFRNNEIYASVARRNEVFAKLEIFSLLSLWKNLDANIRSADSLNAFRSKLKLLYQPLTAPYYF